LCFLQRVHLMRQLPNPSPEVKTLAEASTRGCPDLGSSHGHELWKKVITGDANTFGPVLSMTVERPPRFLGRPTRAARDDLET
jgi:hypothetical protein